MLVSWARASRRCPRALLWTTLLQLNDMHTAHFDDRTTIEGEQYIDKSEFMLCSIKLK
jgi:hypothetical protein